MIDIWDKKIVTKGVFAGMLATLLCGNVGAGQIGIGDFSGSETVTTFNSLGLPVKNSTPIVFDGNTYTTANGRLRYGNFGSGSGCSGECIGTNSDLSFLDVVLSSPATRVGALAGITTASGTGFAEFFSVADVLIGTVNINGFGFAGWEDLGGISRMRYTDTASNGQIALMDDFRFEGRVDGQIPEPVSLALMGLGLAGIGYQRRKQVKAA